jgi:hypothetical protein
MLQVPVPTSIPRRFGAKAIFVGRPGSVALRLAPVAGATTIIT